MANWELIGEVVVNNTAVILNEPIILSNTFRITTTILNQTDWDLWKFRSGAYLSFAYALGANSPPSYIKVRPESTIYEFAPPRALQELGAVRFAIIGRASRYLPRTPNDMFASWKLKLEALDEPIIVQPDLASINAQLAAIRAFIGE